MEDRIPRDIGSDILRNTKVVEYGQRTVGSGWEVPEQLPEQQDQQNHNLRLFIPKLWCWTTVTIDMAFPDSLLHETDDVFLNYS